MAPGGPFVLDAVKAHTERYSLLQGAWGLNIQELQKVRGETEARSRDVTCPRSPSRGSGKLEQSLVLSPVLYPLGNATPSKVLQGAG